MKKFNLTFLFLLITGFSFCNGYEDYEEIDKTAFDKLLDIFYSQYRFCTIEINFSAEEFSTMDNKIHYYLITWSNSGDSGEETHKFFEISKNNLFINIKFEDETVRSYQYTNKNKIEFIRNLNKALQFFE
jgi:hypothetical protein